MFHVPCLKKFFEAHRLERPTCNASPVISMVNRSGDTEFLSPLTWHLSPVSNTGGILSIRTSEDDVIEVSDEQSLQISQPMESQHEILLPETRTQWTRKLCIAWNPDERFRHPPPNPNPSEEEVLRVHKAMAEVGSLLETNLPRAGINH